MRSWAVLVLAACSQNAKPAPAPITQTFSNELDLLFVMEGTLNEEQTVFAANFPKLVQMLDAFPGGRPNLHIGIVTSTVDLGVGGFGPSCPSPDPSDDGLLQNTPRVTGCSPPSGRFIVDVATASGGRNTNYSGTLDVAFSCIAQVGRGCGFVAPLEGMKRALDGSRVENDGFLRDTANLGLLILADEDDCSAADPTLFTLGSDTAGPGNFRCAEFGYECDQPISTTEPGTYSGCVLRHGTYLAEPKSYVDFLHAIRPAQRVAVGLISGDAPAGADGKWSFATGPVTSSIMVLPSCSLGGTSIFAKPGFRLQSFVDEFGADGQWNTICRPDYSAAQTDYGALLQQIMKPCVAGAIDARDSDMTNPGIQPACTVTYSNDTGTQSLPLCTMANDATPAAGATGCAWFTADDSCGTAANLAVHATENFTAPGASLAVTCEAAP
jgi:hypothetical protein